MSRNIHHTGITGYMSDRYGPPKPKIETILWVKPHELTLADLHRLVDMTDNYPENTRVHIHKDRIVAVQEETKPVEMHHRGGGHLQWTVGVDMEDGKGTPITTKIDQPRDHLGRFTKRD
jgi:hypothetical protein